MISNSINFKRVKSVIHGFQMITKRRSTPETNADQPASLITSNWPRTYSPHVRDTRFQNSGGFVCGVKNPEKFFWWNPESWVLESRIQLKDSGIMLTIRSISTCLFVEISRPFM